MVLRFALGELSPEDADDARAFEQREVQRQLRNVPARETDDEVSSAPADAAKCRLGERAADRIVDHIRTVAVGQRGDTLAQIFAAVADRGVGAVLAGEPELLVAGRGGNYARTDRLADFHGGQSDPAGCAE